MISFDDFKPYTCDNFAVTTNDCRNDNMLGYTGLAWALRALCFSKVPLDEMMTVMRSVDPKGVGLLNRLNSPKLQTADDYYDLIAGLALNGEYEEVFSILEYGRANLWNYNNLEPGKWTWKTWFGKFPALIAHMCYGTMTAKPGWFTRTYWALAMLFTAKFTGLKNQDGYRQTWAMAVTYLRYAYRWPQDAGKLQDFAVAVFMKRLRDLGGLEAILAAYINNPNHPLVKYAKEAAY